MSEKRLRCTECGATWSATTAIVGSRCGVRLSSGTWCDGTLYADEPDACRDSVHDSYYDEGFAAANWLRWCDAWIAIGVTAEAVHGAALIARKRYGVPYERAHQQTRYSMALLFGIPAAEVK